MYYYLEIITNDTSPNRAVGELQAPPVEGLSIKSITLTNKYQTQTNLTFDILKSTGENYSSIFENPEDRPVLLVNTKQTILSGLNIPIESLAQLQLRTAIYSHIQSVARITAIIELYDGSLGLFDEVIHQTAEIASNGVAQEEVGLGKSFILLRLEADRACRVRVYSSAAFRDADASRPIGEDITGNHGLIQESVLTPENLVDNSQPKPIGSSAESPRESNAFLSVQNLSGASSPVTITFNKFSLES